MVSAHKVARVAASVDTGTAGTPFGINLAAGAGVMVASVLVAPVLFPDVPARLAVVALAVGGFAALVDDARAGLAVGGLGYLLFDGFLVNQYGELTWTGTTTVWHVAAFALALMLGLGLRRVRAIRSRAAMNHELHELLHTKRIEPKESHGG